jgi:hypothetical protein
MSPRAWSEEMVGELKRLRRLGFSFGRIARRLGVTRNAAIGKAMRLGFRVRVRASTGQGRSGACVPEPAPLGAPREILGRGACRWIAGEAEGAWRMCGHPSVHGSSWCAHHLARVFESVSVAPSEKGAASSG